VCFQKISNPPTPTESYWNFLGRGEGIVGRKLIPAEGQGLRGEGLG